MLKHNIIGTFLWLVVARVCISATYMTIMIIYALMIPTLSEIVFHYDTVC